METLYPYFLIVHLLCAIMLLGFVFTDVVLLCPLRKALGDELAEKIFGIIARRGVKIMPFALLVLMLSGGAMISRYIGGAQGIFDTPLQMALVIKMLLAFCIFAMVVFSLSCKALKRKNPLAKSIHPLVLVLGLMIVILAKMAFYL